MDASILFGIVCFREKYWETQSFRDIIKSYRQSLNNSTLYLSIYDNTDYKDWSIQHDYINYENVIINYYRDSSNSGISAAFNYFAEFSKKIDTKWIVFLDQDTSLSIDFFTQYLNKSINTNKNIVFPKVYTKSKLLSPSNYNCYRTSVIKNIASELLLNNITAINSGIMIRTDFFLQNNGYNKNLRIDFCDHEFIERLSNKNISADILDISLCQEFSVQSNDKKKALERYKIYIKDLQVYKKNKNKVLFFLRVDLPHLLKEIYKHKSLEFLKIRFNV